MTLNELPQGTVRVGVDVVDVERMRRALTRRPRLAAKLFTVAERELCDARPDPATHYAARFAAKESVRKALGRAVGWHDVEVRHQSDGSPRLALSDSVTVDGSDVRAVSLSLAHDGGVAVAAVVVQI